MLRVQALEGEVAVMSIVGPYRTGKSFLLNQVPRSRALSLSRARALSHSRGFWA